MMMSFVIFLVLFTYIHILVETDDYDYKGFSTKIKLLNNLFVFGIINHFVKLTYFLSLID